MDKPELRSQLSVVRGLGSAREGTGHFIAQRVSALILAPLTVWFAYSLIRLAASAERVEVVKWLSSGINASAIVVMLLALFYHAKLGMQVIIEDYVHCPCVKMASLLVNLVAMIAFAAISVIAVLKIHLIS